MNTPHDHDDPFDRAMRELHAQALAQVSAPTRVRLRAARAAATHRPAAQGLRWALAAAFVAVFALAVGLRGGGPRSTTPAQTAAIDENGYDAAATLDENPDFYLWLASNDDTLPTNWER